LLVLAPASLPLGMTHYHYIRGWVSPYASPDRCRKSRPPPEFDPWTVQAVVSRYKYMYTSSN